MPGVEIGDFGSPDETRAPDKTMIEIVRMAARFNPALYRELMGFPEDFPNLAALHPPGGNTRPVGVKKSWYALRQQGKLSETY